MEKAVQHTVTYRVVSVLTVASWLSRMALFGYLCYVEVFLRIRSGEFEADGAFGGLFGPAILFAGNFSIFILSGHWLRMLMKNGLAAALTFDSTRKNSTPNFGQPSQHLPLVQGFRQVSRGPKVREDWAKVKDGGFGA
jgi:hypothetical protein